MVCFIGRAADAIRWLYLKQKQERFLEKGQSKAPPCEWQGNVTAEIYDYAKRALTGYALTRSLVHYYTSRTLLIYTTRLPLHPYRSSGLTVNDTLTRLHVLLSSDPELMECTQTGKYASA